MLVILAGDQLLSPQQVCQQCLLADRSGQPRWQNGQLKCGGAAVPAISAQTQQYECPMGFRIARID
jgi:hypothetical protein